MLQFNRQVCLKESLRDLEWAVVSSVVSGVATNVLRPVGIGGPLPRRSP